MCPPTRASPSQLHQADPLSGDAAPDDDSLSPRAQRVFLELQVEKLEGAINAVLDSRAGGPSGASGSGAAGGGAAAELADAPDEFLDPILMTLMQARWVAGARVASCG